MEIKVKDKEIVIRHKLKRGENYRIQKGKKFESVTFFNKPIVMSGYSNMCDDNKGIILMDYDSVDFKVLEEDYQHLQKKWKLPQSYVVKTDKGYHLVCLKKYFMSEIYQILRESRCDINFTNSPTNTPYRSYVLRLSAKINGKRPKFVGMLGENKNLQYEISKAHLTLLNKIFKLPKINYRKIGKCHKIKLQLYECSR